MRNDTASLNLQPCPQLFLHHLRIESLAVFHHHADQRTQRACLPALKSASGFGFDAII